MIDIDEADKQATQAQAWVVRYVAKNAQLGTVNNEKFCRMLEYRDIFKAFFLSEQGLPVPHNMLAERCEAVRQVTQALTPVVPPPPAQMKELLGKHMLQYVSACEPPLFQELPLTSLEWANVHETLTKPKPPSEEMVTLVTRHGRKITIPKRLVQNIGKSIGGKSKR